MPTPWQPVYVGRCGPSLGDPHHKGLVTSDGIEVAGGALAGLDHRVASNACAYGRGQHPCGADVDICRGGPLLATAAVDDSAVNGFYSELYGPKSPPLRPYDPCPHGTGVNRGSNGDSPTLEHDAGGCTVVEHGV